MREAINQIRFFPLTSYGGAAAAVVEEVDGVGRVSLSVSV